MRKVLVCGAAFAAACVSAVAIPGGAEATAPAPTPSATPSQETGPSGSPRNGTPGSQSPSASSTAQPSQGQAGPDGEPDGTVSAQAVMVTPEPPKFRTFAYGESVNQRMDVYWRESGPRAKPRPVVLFLHGGSWMMGDKGGGWKYFARRLTDEGFVVVSANYRLAPKARWPAQRDDALAALTFIKEHAGSWNVDPRRVGVIGSSAGGQLATQLGTFGTGTAQVRGVIALSPPNNPYMAFQDGAEPTASSSQRALRRAVTDFVGCVPDVTAVASCGARLDDASSVTHVSAGDAPMLLMHGSDDFVPVAQSTELAGALRAAGVEAKVETVEGATHAAALLNATDTYPTIVAWLRKHLRPSAG